MLSGRGQLVQAASLPRLLFSRNVSNKTRGRKHSGKWTGPMRGKGHAWHNAGRGPVFAKDGQEGFPDGRLLPLRTNRIVNFVPRHIKKSSSAWLFRDRFPNTSLQRVANIENKPWTLSEDEYKAIKSAYLKPPMRERQLTPIQLIQTLRKEEILKTKKFHPREIPDFKTGDRIAVTRYMELNNEENTKLETVKGMVIGRKNCMNESTVWILNNRHDTTFEMKIPIWSPFVKEIEVLQKGTIKKRKALYLRDRPVDEFQT